MAFDKEQFKDLIKETLKEIDMYSPAAVNLLMGTAAQESAFGTFDRQLGGGPAVGPFQMEPATRGDIHDNYLRYKPELLRELVTRFPLAYDADAMIKDTKYAVVMARLHYRRVKEALPNADDVEALGRYWKEYYNTPKGKGTVEEFVWNYRRFVG